MENVPDNPVQSRTPFTEVMTAVRHCRATLTHPFFHHGKDRSKIFGLICSDVPKDVVGKCDVEENEDIAMEFGIRNIPTILFFKGGQIVDKIVGAQAKARIQEKFEALL